VPAPVTLVGVSVHARPVEGLTDEVSPTIALKPCKAAVVIVDEPAWVASTGMLVRLAPIVKSCTVNVKVAE
jgi:hypothetical protein